ncbi:MAG: chemotaxis protein CheA [Candidatus Riflebacteria bacterium]|nr:chemotaxis protein CheA [Candidatus Riflebacteria bacterium]
MDNYQKAFKLESSELLFELESGLIELESSPESKDAIERVFRSLHTIKGNSRVVGFEDIGNFVHTVESVFDQIRRGLLKFNSELGNITLSISDHIKGLLEEKFGGPKVDPAVSDELTSLILSFSAESTEQSKDQKGKDILPEIDLLISRIQDIKTSEFGPRFLEEVCGMFTNLQAKFEPFAADIAEFAGQFVKTLKRVLSDNLKFGEDFIDLLSDAAVYLREALNETINGPAFELWLPEKILEELNRPMLLTTRLKTFFPEAKVEKVQLNSINSKPEVRELPEKLFRIKFTPPSDLFSGGNDPFQIFNELARIGKMVLIAHSEQIPSLAEIEPEKNYITWDILLTTNREKSSVEDAFFFVHGSDVFSIKEVESTETLDEADGGKKLGEILIERGTVSREKLDFALNLLRPLGEQLISQGIVSEEKVQSALIEQGKARPQKTEKSYVESTSHQRVTLDKLDHLVGLIGELVTLQARLGQTGKILDDSDVNFVSEEMGRLTERLRESYMQIRMQPIGITFYKFNRMINELAFELGKEIEVVTEGAETELDKATIEKLNDPLVHLIRNSVDHGLESKEERIRAGKPTRGIIKLCAEHSAGNVIIKVSDDGGGLKTDKIREKAIERGLIPSDSKMSDDEINNLIFLPGFSTAQNVTSISGRGSGLDVVKNAIDDLKGTMSIRTKRGAGTTFIFKLPLTLAIIEGLLVRISDKLYIFPLSSVKECVSVTPDKITLKDSSRGLSVIRGEMIPFIHIAMELRIAFDQAVNENFLVIVSSHGMKFGVLVNDIIGIHQTVLKPLGKSFSEVKAFSGATVLGDGTVALIFDVDNLLQSEEHISWNYAK